MAASVQVDVQGAALIPGHKTLITSRNIVSSVLIASPNGTSVNNNIQAQPADDQHSDHEPDHARGGVDIDTDSDDDDLDAEVGDSSSRPISEKRRIENEILKAYALKLSITTTKHEIREARSKVKDESLSIKELLAKQDKTNKIVTPRDYQIELFERAKAQNIIAVLGTGSGKTHIATLLLRWILDRELEDRAARKPPKIAFFLVNSVNLVFQQAGVLQCNLDQSVAEICGAHGPSLWNRKTWQKYFANNMVIVCTAEVLNQCLMHSFITIDRINLLIFDEAHHAKPGRNHPFAVIIKEYYLKESDKSKRPRIFGMTASPVDANSDVQQTATDLETLMHCQIATTSDADLLKNHIHKPEEKVVRYSRLVSPFETELHQELKAAYGHVDALKRLFEASKIASSELGSWCSDQFWAFGLPEEEARRLEDRESRRQGDATQSTESGRGEKAVAELDERLQTLRSAQEMVASHPCTTPVPDLMHLSSKVFELHALLRSYYERPTDSRCLVFVERRATARLLHTLFGFIGGPFLKPGRLVGNRTGSIGDSRTSIREQVLTMTKFRSGELNCLFATSVAEEGLDIPACNLIVRFDECKNMIQYVQSRGRARMRNSAFIHLMEHNNFTQYERLLEHRTAEEIMREFCEALPSDRRLDAETSSETLDQALEKERQLPTYSIAKTGATLNFRSSLGVLAHFVDSVPRSSDMDGDVRLHYIVTRDGDKYVSEVVLPPNAPQNPYIGKPFSRKATAKCSAAYEACIKLKQDGFLDDHFLPTYTKILPAMRNAKLALDLNKKNTYGIKMKPDVWNSGLGQKPSTLYLTVIDVTNGVDYPQTPIALVTRSPLPSLPHFPLFFDDGRQSDVQMIPLQHGFEPSDQEVAALNAITLCMFSDVFNKFYQEDFTEMSPWWIAPLIISSLDECASIHDPRDLINWGVCQGTLDRPVSQWVSGTPSDFYVDRFLVDGYHGGRRYFTLHVDADVKPTDNKYSKVKNGQVVEQNVLEFTSSLWKKSKMFAKREWDLDQPVLKALKMPMRRNYLAPLEEKELVEQDAEGKECWICPELLKVSSLPTGLAAMCCVVPAVIHRIEQYVIVLECTATLGLEIGPALALEALTKDSDNTSEHDSEKVNFRRGMGNNYERLEFIGDCFLKTASSISLFVNNPEEDEFSSHVKRMVMTSNQRLYDVALSKDLTQYVRSLPFGRRTWYPSSLTLLRGKQDKGGPPLHSLGDKTISDVCEALIGASFVQHHDRAEWAPARWDMAVRAVTAFVKDEEHAVDKWNDYYDNYNLPKYQIAQTTASQRDLAAQVERKHPYHFKYPRLLRSAFCHPSYGFSTERIPHYERLEFLGDALLDLVFICDIFFRFPNKDPQWLTEHKMPMVSNKFLAALCVKLKFYPHLRKQNAQLDTRITEWVTEVQEAERDAKGAVDYWTTISEPPKCLADMVEAYVAAIFVDSEFDFAVVQDFYNMHIAPYFVDMAIYDSFANSHPLTRLHQVLGTHLGCRNWRIGCAPIEVSVLPGEKQHVAAMLMVHGRVVADEVGLSNRYARIRVANKGLEMVEGKPPFEFRELFGCDCKEDDEEPVVGESVS